MRVRDLFLCATLFFRHTASRDVLTGDNDGTLVVRRLCQPLNPAIKTEAIANHQRRVRKFFGIGRRWIEGMRIAIGANQGDNNGMISRNLPHNIAEHAKTGDDFNRGRQTSRRHQQEEDCEKGSACQCVCSFNGW